MKNKLIAFDNNVEIISQKRNENGYLVLKCIFARTGIQERYGAEINPDFEATKLYREYRSPKEVFKPEVLEAFKNVVITNDHPQELLTSQNTKYHAIGFVSSEVAVVDDTYLQCEITIYDDDAIDDIENGKSELSAGYLYSLLMVENMDYDYIQTDIKPNHIAIVQAGRCGSACSLAFDTNPNQNKGNDMKKIVFKRMLPDGKEAVISEIEVSDESAEAVQGVADMIFEKSKKMLEASQGKDEDEVKAKDEEIESLKTELSSKDEEIDKLQAQIDTNKEQNVGTDSKAVMAMAQDLAGVIVVANDCGIDTTGKDTLSLKKEVIGKYKPELALDGKSESYVESAFDIVALQIKDADSSFLRGLDAVPSKALDEKQKEQNEAQDSFNSKFGGNS